MQLLEVALFLIHKFFLQYFKYVGICEIEECEFGDEVSRSVGSALMFSDDIPCPPKAALGTERRFPSKLATFLSEKKEISDALFF